MIICKMSFILIMYRIFLVSIVFKQNFFYNAIKSHCQLFSNFMSMQIKLKYIHIWLYIYTCIYLHILPMFKNLKLFDKNDHEKHVLLYKILLSL